MRALLRRLLVPLFLCVLPVIAERVLVLGLEDSGAAGVMLGAVSGSSPTSVAATIVALVLRIYTVVLMPAIAVYLLVAFLLRPRSAGLLSLLVLGACSAGMRGDGRDRGPDPEPDATVPDAAPRGLDAGPDQPDATIDSGPTALPYPTRDPCRIEGIQPDFCASARCRFDQHVAKPPSPEKLDRLLSDAPGSATGHPPPQ